jgi:hypothetical protein
MVAVAVGQDDGGHGLRRNLRDIVQQLLTTRLGRLRVNDDHAVAPHNHRAVASTALDPVDIRLQLVGDKRAGCGVCPIAAAANVPRLVHASPLIKISLQFIGDSPLTEILRVETAASDRHIGVASVARPVRLN